ncbi:unnamed protein product [Linum tenue]|uniref:CCR4-NOT transcription complex subunit 4 n=1 Tax=Linum tenue TaxID=586396 RepID=A0AAV0QJF5_9ROSI|nr:unnamed protein product [Linum tenue]
MSDEGEKTCPLCAEEMDLTDQQLKPCKCGYEICVWCWHHIMDMAEKDDSEGRCPACRTPYDKEKIVGTGPNERLVAEFQDRKKSHKSKTKPSEGRKQLSSVRVIQRNLVYIVGLPLNFADEDLLQRREYFGQYGKVLKVSMSRTAAGVIQQFPNNTCSVYITYGKEDEAIRCIQSVHGYILDGRPLKACFGTTKYCHAWLRNVPCTNPDCLYLHEVGSQEVSFTKDEIISSYTRSRVQQITGATSNLVPRAGNMLPPPSDDYSYNTSASSARPILKNAVNSTMGSSGKGSPPNGSGSRSGALPAAASWGMRSSNQPLNLTFSNGPPKLKSDTVASTVGFSSATVQPSASFAVKTTSWNEDSQSTNSKCKPDLLVPLKQLSGGDSPPIVTEKASLSNTSANIHLTKDSGRAEVSSVKSSLIYPQSSSHEQDGLAIADEKILSSCPEISSTRIGRNDNSGAVSRTSSVFPENTEVKFPSGQQQCVEQYGDSLASPASEPAANGVYVSREEKDWRMDPQTEAVPISECELEEDVLSFDNQRLRDPELVSCSLFLPSSVNSLQAAKSSWSHSLQHTDALGTVEANPDPLFLDHRIGDGPIRHMPSNSVLPNGYPETFMNSSTGLGRHSEQPLFRPGQGEGEHLGRLQCDSNGNATLDAGESSIISNILSLDLDGWDESLTSPQKLAKMLGDTDPQTSSLKMSNSWKGQSNKQSRFSFARQEESRNHAFDVDPSFIGLGQMPRNHSFNPDLLENRNSFLDKHGLSNGFSSSNMDESESYLGGTSAFPSSKPSVSRSQISAPPGFSVPNRAPPPGFSSHERVEQTFDSISGNHLFDSSSLLRSSYQAPMGGSMGSTADIEFIDPAILAVGKGRLQGAFSNNNSPGLDMRSNFPQQYSNFENDARLQQLLMQRSLPQQQQNLRYGDLGDNFSSLTDSYGLSSRMVDQSQLNNLSPFAQLSVPQPRGNGHVSNGHWGDGWNEVQGGGNSLGMAELLRNERLGQFNKFYSSGYEDSKFRMPSSGDLYNRTFEM